MADMKYLVGRLLRKRMLVITTDTTRVVYWLR